MSKKEILNQYMENGICSYEYADINGIKQYIQIRGESKDNPLLLVLHGGPGGTISGFAHVLQPEWEKLFTVVNFDQRNSGKTYLANKKNALEIGQTGSIDDYIKDIDGVIEYLHTKYEFDKLFLLGFSWGSVIGAEYAKKYPDKLEAYIGVGQVVNFEKGYKLVCEKAIEKAKEANNQKDVFKLQQLIDEYPQQNIMTKERLKTVRSFAILANKYLVKNAKRIPLKAILSSPFLNFKEKKTLFLSDVRLLNKTYETFLSYNFFKDTHFEVPVCLVTGEEDINCPVKLLEDQWDRIEAPIKLLFTIDKAAHSCFYDNSEEFIEVMKEILSV